ncbi:MAG: dienelactone hydrolase family protein [Betaproteobacteria bacterium]
MTEKLELRTASGNIARAELARPEGKKAPDAGAGYLALAVDLFEGKVTDQPAAAIAWLRASPASNGKVGTLGFCLGGAWSLNASVANPVGATVVYHGAVNKNADELRALKGPVLGHFALRESYIPPDSAKAFAEEMKKAGKPAAVHFYDAAHAFTRPQGPNFDPAANDLAWAAPSVSCRRTWHEHRSEPARRLQRDPHHRRRRHLCRGRRDPRSL